MTRIDIDTARRLLLKAAGAGGLGALLASCGGGSTDTEAAPVPLAADDGTQTALAASRTTATLATTSLKGRVLVVGGGMAGAAVAKYVRLWGGSGVQVTLIERATSYTSNIMSNFVLTGQKT
ncbi:MAG TPA: hypothetical protein PLN55_10580, partial [Burkholderiaceae bacterium]|nr:hypothetical protein [Burkholderiaceae bacterium]